MWRFCRRPTRTRWATPERWCCIRTERWKASTIRAPTAGRRESESALAIPARGVIAPARLAGAARGEQQAERKADADAERHHRLGMPADLLAHHVVEVGGALLRTGDGVAGIVAGGSIGVGSGPFGLLVDALGLLAGLLGGILDRLAALLECLEAGIRHKSLRGTLFREETQLPRK